MVTAGALWIKGAVPDKVVWFSPRTTIERARTAAYEIGPMWPDTAPNRAILDRQQRPAANLVDESLPRSPHRGYQVGTRLHEFHQLCEGNAKPFKCLALSAKCAGSSHEPTVGLVISPEHAGDSIERTFPVFPTRLQEATEKRFRFSEPLSLFPFET
jgi:hypothetical protein